MFEINVDNRDGLMWNLSGIASDVTYKTTRVGQASSFEFTILKGGFYESKDFKYKVGDIIRVKMDGVPLFYGYIFTIESGRDENVKFTAYDQLRYLLANDTYVMKDVTATEVIDRIAKDFKLKVGTLEDTGYKIPRVLEDTKKLLDIICKVLEKTLIATKKLFIFYDDFGELTLRDAESMVPNLSIGDVSLLYDYKQKRTIEDSYNKVVIIQDNKKTGKRDKYVHIDNENVAKWGLLQLYQSADEKMNKAQIEEALKNLIELKNREGQTFQVDAIGDIRVRAGCYVSINVEELGLGQRFLVNRCTHKFDGVDHTMSLDLVDIRIGDKEV